MKLPITLHGILAIFALAFILLCLVFGTACTGEAPVQQVKWDYKERCSVLFNKECGCVETPTEEWQRNFKC